MKNEYDQALQPVRVNGAPEDRYAPRMRSFQGIPGIETAHGVWWATWYSGGKTEGPDNHVVLARSEDQGVTWKDPTAVIDPPGLVRAFDPVLWRSPEGELWWFWSQSYEWFDGRAGVWSSRCADGVTWSAPVRIANGVMMNKPAVTKAGEWLLPVALWDLRTDGRYRERMPQDVYSFAFANMDRFREERMSSVVVSTDGGRSFSRRGGIDIPARSYDEHMVVELSDGRLWMLVRMHAGIAEAFSQDGGHSWKPGSLNRFNGPNSRFCIRRLASGSLVFINNDTNHGGSSVSSASERTNLKIFVSTDDGMTWESSLLLDDREAVAYPDCTQTDNGTILTIYDRGRTTDREILLAVLTEDDILSASAGKSARLRQIVSRAG